MLKTSLFILLLAEISENRVINRRATEDERKIVCYYTNWSVYRPESARFFPNDINPYLCTHLIYAFAGFSEKSDGLKPFDEWQDITMRGYQQFTDLKKFNDRLKTLIAIGGWREGPERFSRISSTRERRSVFAKNVAAYLRRYKFDGINFDWQFPADREGSSPMDKQNYVRLLQTLQEEFEKESFATMRPKLLLSMSAPCEIEYLEKGYDIPGLIMQVDFMNILTYDYHLAYDPYVNHHAPLYPLAYEKPGDVNYELNIVDLTWKRLTYNKPSGTYI